MLLKAQQTVCVGKRASRCRSAISAPVVFTLLGAVHDDDDDDDDGDASRKTLKCTDEHLRSTWEYALSLMDRSA